MELHQKIVLNHWDDLQQLCERLCIRHNKLYLADDMFCEAIVDKSERAFNSFDPSRNDNLEYYMLSCFRFYCRDWLAKHFNRQRFEVNLSDSNSEIIKSLSVDGKLESSALSARDEVIAILGVLSSFERRLLTLRIGYGWTYTELAEALKQPESSVRVATNEALLKAQWYAKQRIKRNIV